MDPSNRLPLAMSLGLVVILVGSGSAIYLTDKAVKDAAVSSGANELEVQAEIAECLAGEARRMAAAWALDVRSSRGHAPPGYEAEMDGMIAVSIESAGAMEAWADAVRQAAVDGTLTADERAILEAAERDMADADEAVHDALISTSAWRLAGMAMAPDSGIADAHRQLSVLSGDGTDCY